jgi:hypothetical protein
MEYGAKVNKHWWSSWCIRESLGAVRDENLENYTAIENEMRFCRFNYHSADESVAFVLHVIGISTSSFMTGSLEFASEMGTCGPMRVTWNAIAGLHSPAVTRESLRSRINN